MNTMRIRKTLFAALVGLSSCAPMMTDVDQMRNVTDDIRIENEAHLDNTRAASTLSAVQQETARHEGVTDSLMSNVDATMVSMSAHCFGTGVTDLRTMHVELDGEMAQHADIMAAAVDLAAARAEVERHGGLVAATMSAMDGAMGRMSCTP